MQFECRAPSLVGLRRLWLRKVDVGAEGRELCHYLDHQGKFPNESWRQMRDRARDGSESGGSITDAAGNVIPLYGSGRAPVRELSRDDLSLRRAVSGVLDGAGLPSNKRMRGLLTEAVETGLALQLEGKRLTAQVERAARESAAAVKQMRPAWEVWRLEVIALSLIHI